MANEQNLKPAQKGEIRNPKGRPKGSLNRATLVAYWMGVEEKSTNPISKQLELLAQEDLMILGQIKAARKGNTYAFDCLMKLRYGLPPQALTGAEGGPIQFETNVKELSTEQLLAIVAAHEQPE